MLKILGNHSFPGKTLLWGMGTAVLLAGFYFFLLRSSVRPSGGLEEPFFVKIRILHNVGKINISSTVPCALYDATTGKAIANDFKFKDPSVASFFSGRVVLDEAVLQTGDLHIVVKGRGLLDVDGTEYRGEMDVITTEGGLDVVNTVEIENYLKGVVPREVSPFWPLAAIKAQAIASRTFAVSQALSRRYSSYHMTADTFSQVYGGRTAERWRSTDAVKRTRGEVLVYGGKIFPAYFHSACGGHTTDALSLWGENAAPLRGVKCGWCRWSPYFRWQVRVPTKTIVQKLKDAGYSVDRIDDIRTGERDASDRVGYMNIKSGGKWFDIKAGDFAFALGKGAIRSTNVRVKKYPLFYYFSGYGWGHGVGMCQWGAFGLAMKWWSARNIVKYFYPGAEITHLRDVLKNTT